MTKIKENRAKRYAELRGVKSQQRVYTHNLAQYGFVLGFTSPYVGEAGYSERVRVLWVNGQVTLCCIKGMTAIYRNHYRIR